MPLANWHGVAQLVLTPSTSSSSIRMGNVEILVAGLKA